MLGKLDLPLTRVKVENVRCSSTVWEKKSKTLAEDTMNASVVGSFSVLWVNRLA